jgi:hypothetical protein
MLEKISFKPLFSRKKVLFPYGMLECRKWFWHRIPSQESKLRLGGVNPKSKI